MNAKLPDGGTRIDAARTAVADLVAKLPNETRLSFRVYGHQSPTQKHDCVDTELMVGFNSVAANRDTILAKSRGVKAQGYTPITYVLKLSAEEVGKEPGAHIVLLVSDGQETCAGDPCATAKALADADAKLVVHTIGFGVDTAARYQLQCIAKMARGSYFDARSAGNSPQKLGEAVKAEPAKSTVQVTVTVPKPGKLQMKPIEELHDVSDDRTGKKVAALTTSRPTIELPSGIYNVAFGSRSWKSIEVRAERRP